MADAIKVLIVDDHQVVRRGLRTFLEVQDDIEVVGEAADGAEGVARTEELKPDVVLMDVKMPGMDGIEALRRLRELDHPARVLIVTSFTEQRTVIPALRAGAAGYVAKNATKETLLDALRAVASGGCYFAGDLVGTLMARQRYGNALAAAGLSPRELEVLDLVVAGLTHKQIGARLALAKATVDTYVQRIRQKCGNRTKVALVRLAVECGLGKN